MMKVKEESEKTGLKLNIQKMKIMASSPITSQQIEGEKLKAVKDFIFLNSKSTRIFIGRTDAEAKAPILWPHDVKSWLTGKDSDAQKYWRQKKKGVSEDEMVGCHHQLDGHGCEQSAGDSKG